jgi:hypothetical protein
MEDRDNYIYELIATKISDSSTYTVTDISEPIAFKPCSSTGDRCLILYSSTQILADYSVSYKATSVNRQTTTLSINNIHILDHSECDCASV